MTIKLFGPFEASREEGAFANLQTRDAGRLLALLTLQQGRTVPGTAAAQALWPATGSLDNLRQSITHLRRVLASDGERLQTPKGNVRLDLAGNDVYLVHFDTLVKG